MSPRSIARAVVPRTLAGQAVGWLLALVAIIVLAGSAVAAMDARLDSRSAAREEVTAVAVSLADAPSTASALVGADPTAVLQPVTEHIRQATGIAFITVMRPDGTRYTHTNPALIGDKYLGTRDEALAGKVFTETYTGTLGPSIRTIAPVRDPDGTVVGMVAAGITLQSLADSWQAQLPLIAALAASALLVAILALLGIRRRLLRQTGGLAPAELRLMYEHHDAVLHAVREGLVVTEHGTPVLMNDEARRLLGDTAASGSSRTGEGLPRFVTDGDGALVDELYAYDGRSLMVSRSPVADGAGSAVVTIRDQTELAAAMGELDSMTRFAEALRSQAHESANRLHTVIAMIEMGRAADAAQLAASELELSQRLIDRMSGAVTEPALAALLLGKTAHAAERGIDFTLTEDSQLGDDTTTLLTRTEMITVVGNLVDNALDACDPADPWVEVTITGDADGLSLVVADSGPGMDAAEFARAQVRGYSSKEGGDRAGRGIGLALVAQVVARRGGTITSENTYGSVITVTIGRVLR